MEEEETAAVALQYPRCYSTPAGTVHEMAARVGGGVGGAGSEDRDTR